MTPEQENIIKDKLLEYEVPFEEKFWEDFQKKSKNKAVVPPNYRKYYLGLAAIALISFGALLFIPGKNNAIADNSVNNPTDQNISQIINNDNSNSNIDKFSDNSSAKQVNPSDEINVDHSNTNKAIESNTQVNSEINTKNQTVSNTTIGNQSIATNAMANNSIENGAKSNVSSNDLQNNSSGTLSSEENNINASVPDNNVTAAANMNHSAISNTNNNGNSNPSGIIDQNINSSNTTIDNQLSNTNSNTFDNQFPTSVIEQSNLVVDESNNSVVASTDAPNNKLTDVINREEQIIIDMIDQLPPNVDKSDPIKDELPEESSVDLDVNQPKKWEVGIYSGIGLNIPIAETTNLETSYNIKGGGPNLSAGAFFKYSLNKKISLETGLKYKKLANNFSSSYTLIDNVNLIGIEEVTIVQNLHSVEIPMGINLRLGKSDWLDFSTGLSLAYVKAGKTFKDSDIQNPLSYPNPEENFYLATFNNYGIRNIDVRAYAGFTFNVSSFLAFRMLINQGFIDRTRNDYYFNDKFDTHRDYSFSAIIRFKPKGEK